MTRAIDFFPAALAVAALALAGNSVTHAASGVATMQQGGAATAQVMAAYKKTSWERYKSLSGGTAAASDLPPTDCPPEPVQVCQDSWKPKLINPFPGRSINTVNPFE